jgi:hypothetical protein
MISAFAKFTRSLGRKSLKREFALVAVIVWIATTFHTFWGLDAAAAAAQAVNYGTLSSTVWLYVAAAVGLQTWERNQDAKAEAAAPPAGDIPWESGEPEPVAPRPE